MIMFKNFSLKKSRIGNVSLCVCLPIQSFEESSMNILDFDDTCQYDSVLG